jgi:hypothetical protein
VSLPRRPRDWTTRIYHGLERAPLRERQKDKPRHRRVLYRAKSAPLPYPAKEPAFGRFCIQVSLQHMENENKREAPAPGTPPRKPRRRAKTAPPCQMEIYAVQGLTLGRKIFEKLEKVDESVGIIAAHMHRESSEKKSADVKAK